MAARNGSSTALAQQGLVVVVVAVARRLVGQPAPLVPVVAIESFHALRTRRATEPINAHTRWTCSHWCRLWCGLLFRHCLAAPVPTAMLCAARCDSLLKLLDQRPSLLRDVFEIRRLRGSAVIRGTHAREPLLAPATGIAPNHEAIRTLVIWREKVDNGVFAGEQC